MALTLLCGFESGSVQGEFRDVYGSPTVQSSVVRSGSYALQVNKSGGASHYLQVFKRAAGGTAIAAFNSFRFYIQIGSLPTTLCQITNGAAAISIHTTGAIKYLSVLSTNTLSEDGLWHLVEVYGNTSTGLVYVDVDNVNWLISAGSMTAATSFSIGAISSSSAVNLYIDDIAIFDTESLGWRGDSKQVLLLPTADPGALNSWTNGGGGTTSIFEGVNNIPPTGTAAATNGIKIKNGASGSNLDYTPTMQTYTAAGVPSGSTVNAVISLCNHGEEVATGTKAGDVWIASNPAQAAGSGTFDYGDDTATIVGTFPTGWRTAYGPGSLAPSVTLGTAPTMTVRKTGSTNRVVDVDFMGIYVDYTPPMAQLPRNSTPPVPPLGVFPSIVGF